MLRDDNLITFMCRLSGNLGTSTSWNPQGLSRDCFTIFMKSNHETPCTHLSADVVAIFIQEGPV